MKHYISIIALLFLLLSNHLAFAAGDEFGLTDISAITITPQTVDAGGKVNVTVHTSQTDVTNISAIFVPERLTIDDIALELTSIGNRSFTGQLQLPRNVFGNTWRLSRLIVYTKNNIPKSFHYTDLEKNHKNLLFSSTNKNKTVNVSAPALSLPATNKVENKDIKVTWTPVEASDHYVFTVQDLTTNKIIINQNIYDTETLILDSEITLNHQYKIGVAAKQGDFLSNYTYKTITVVESLDDTNATTSFSDLAPGHWAKPAIDKLLSKKAIRGYADGTFKPEKNITRAEFITMLVKILEKTELNGISNTFSDVDAAHWAAKEITIAKQNKIIDGYQVGTSMMFKPNANITRAEMVSMVVKATNISAGVASYNFIDTKKHWAKAAINAAAVNLIVKGKGTNTFKPDDKATRAEACIVLSNALKKIK